MQVVEALEREIRSLEEGITYAELTDTAWHPDYTRWVRRRRFLSWVLKRYQKMIRKEEMSRVRDMSQQPVFKQVP